MFNTAYIGLFDRSLLPMSLIQVELALKQATSKLRTTEEASGKRGQVTILVVFVSCSKLAEFSHVTSISVEQHCPVFFSLACASFSRNKVCKKGTPLGKTEWIFA